MPKYTVKVKELWRGGDTKTETISAPSRADAKRRIKQKYRGYGRVKNIKKKKAREEKFKEKVAELKEMAPFPGEEIPVKEKPSPFRGVTSFLGKVAGAGRTVVGEAKEQLGLGKKKEFEERLRKEAGLTKEQAKSVTREIERPVIIGKQMVGAGKAVAQEAVEQIGIGGRREFEQRLEEEARLPPKAAEKVTRVVEKPVEKLKEAREITAPVREWEKKQIEKGAKKVGEKIEPVVERAKREKWFGRGGTEHPYIKPISEVETKAEEFAEKHKGWPGALEKVPGELYMAPHLMTGFASVFARPEYPELVGAGLEQVGMGTGEKTEFFKRHPAQIAPALAGEVLGGMMIGEALSKVPGVGRLQRRAGRKIAKGARKAGRKAGRVYYKGLRRTLGKEAIEELAERPGKTGRLLKEISPEWVRVREPRMVGRTTRMVSGVTEPEELGKGLKARLRTGVASIEERFKPTKIEKFVKTTRLKKFAGVRGPKGGLGYAEEFSGKRIYSLLQPEETGRGVELMLSEAGEKVGRRAGYRAAAEPEILGGRGLPQLMKGFEKTIKGVTKPVFKAGPRIVGEGVGRTITGIGARTLAGAGSEVRTWMEEREKPKRRLKRVPKPMVEPLEGRKEIEFPVPKPWVAPMPEEREIVAPKEITEVTPVEEVTPAPPEPLKPPKAVEEVPVPRIPLMTEFEEEKKKRRTPEEFELEKEFRRRKFDIGSMLKGLEDYEI